MTTTQILVGFSCPRCGNEISIEAAGLEADPQVTAPLCLRCPDGEYTPMEPVYEIPNDDE